MKKTTKLWWMFAIAGVTLFSSCNGDEDDDPEPGPTPTNECDSKTYPSTTGDATVNLLNFSSSEITVEANTTLSLAVEVTKGSKRAQKIRLFQSDCKNDIGTEVDLSDQPKGGKNGIDLRRTDDKQIRNVNYDVPTGFSTIYLTLEIDEAGGNVTYKQLTLSVSGSGVIDTWSNVELGGNSNPLASRMASGTGQTYTACNAGENIDYIDITYAVNTTNPYPSYLCSNPARFESTVGLTTSTATGCGDDGDISTAGGNKSYFKTSTADFDAADNDILDALTIATTDNEYAEVTAAGDVFEFMNSSGKKGLIKVESVNGLNTTGGSITVSVKIQR